METKDINPGRIFNLINAFQTTAAMKAAIELDVFTAIARGNATAGTIARACGAAKRGVRILCDYLVVVGVLSKSAGSYGVPEDAAMFLVKDSPAYLGAAVEFLTAPQLMEAFAHLTEAVKRGGSALGGDGMATEKHEIWIAFARNMAPLLMPLAKATAQRVAELTGGKAGKILDLAASHGMFGIMAGLAHPGARIVAQDGAPVLGVAMENGKKMGVGDRMTTLAGDAWKVDFGSGYNVVLVPNLLHHFHGATCEELLRKVHGCLKPGGVVALAEFVPNEDRVSPAGAATFALIMLADTPAGDAYTFAELKGFMERAGFGNIELRVAPGDMHSIVTGRK